MGNDGLKLKRVSMSTTLGSFELPIDLWHYFCLLLQNFPVGIVCLLPVHFITLSVGENYD